MILITRPNSSAKKLQLKFRKVGTKAFIESLTTIHISDRNIKLQDCMYLISSQHAVDYLKNFLSKDNLKKMEFIVIGHATSKKLLRIGAKKVIKIFEESNELLNYFTKNKMRKKIVYLCGSNRNKSFLQNFKSLTSDFVVRQVYEVVSLKTLSQTLIDSLKKKKIQIVLIFSLNNAKLFLKLCKIDSDTNYTDLKYVCISKQISSFMIQNSCKNATYSEKPNEKMVVQKTLDLLDY
mgnify:CR=1 FL=1